VASRTQKNLTWENSVLLTGDIAAEIKKIKAQAGPELQVHGSSNLIQTLLKNDLVDRILVEDFPGYNRRWQTIVWKRDISCFF